jgi:predicted tellurium resistance membrane protein TerC
LIIAGSALLMKVMERFPILVWAGAALLGWVAGEIIVKDPAVMGWIGADTAERLHYWIAGAGALLVVALGWLLVWWNGRGGLKPEITHPTAVEHAGLEATKQADRVISGAGKS